MGLAKLMQEKLEEVHEEEWCSDSKLGKVKASLAALAGGAIDGAVIAYPIMFIALISATKEIKKLRKK